MEQINENNNLIIKDLHNEYKEDENILYHMEANFQKAKEIENQKGVCPFFCCHYIILQSRQATTAETIILIKETGIVYKSCFVFVFARYTVVT